MSLFCFLFRHRRRPQADDGEPLSSEVEVDETSADVARLIEWLESDGLDWDAVARVRSDGW